MIRGLLALASLAFVAVGLTVTFTTWTVDGWTCLAVLGVAGVWADSEWEYRQEERAQ